MKKPSVLLILTALLFNSCGISWLTKTSSRLNDNLPKQITNYTFLSGDFTSSVDPTLVVGTFLIKVNDTTFVQTEKQYFKKDSLIVLVEFSEDPIYSSKITQSFDANGKYAIAELNADGETAYELVIDRYKFAEVKSDNIDTAKLLKLYRNIIKGQTKISSIKESKTNLDDNYINNPNNYHYIKGVQVNSLITKMYTKTTTSAKVDGGTSTFGAGANVYKSTAGFVKYYTTSVKLIPLPILLKEYSKNDKDFKKAFNSDTLKIQKIEQIDFEKGYIIE